MKTTRSVRCPGCRCAVPYSLAQAGKAGRCPSCDMPLEFPELARISFSCDRCGSRLQAPEDRVGDTLACPKCRAMVRIPEVSVATRPSALAEHLREDNLEVQDDALVPESAAFTSDNRRAYSAWTEFEESRRDSYGQALLRTPLYPLQTCGGIALFVLGVPLLVAVTRFVSDIILLEAAHPSRTEAAARYAATGVAALLLALVLVLAALSASFLFTLMRGTATRSTSIPVIQGLPHRNNLTAFFAWAVLWFGLPLCAGFVGQGGGWRLNVAVLALGAVVFPFAMASLVGVGLEGGRAVLAFGRMGRMLETSGSAFAAALFAGTLTAAFLAGIGVALEIFSQRFSGDTTGIRVTVFFMRIASVMFCMFPVIAMVRALGVYAQYHQARLPWKVAKQGQQASPWSLKLLLGIGCVLCFFPLRAHALAVVDANRTMAQAGVALERIVKLSFINQQKNLPRTEDELKSRFPDLARCPFLPDEEVGYAVYAMPARDMDCIMAMHSKKPSPYNGRWAVLFQGRTYQVRLNLTDRTFRKLEALQKRLLADPKDEAASREMMHLMLMGM